MFRGSSHCSTSPPSHRRIFTITSTQDFPHKEPSLRIWQIQLGVHNSSLQQNNLYTRGKAQQLSPHTRGIGTKPNNNHLFTKRDKAQSQTDQPLTRGIPINSIISTLRGITTKFNAQPPLHLEGKAQSHKQRMITTLGDLK